MNRVMLALVVAASLLASCNAPKPDRVRTKDTTDSVTVKKVHYTKANYGATPEVQVTMNGVPFKMLWDTGATITLISTQEHNQLVKDGAISPDDYVRNIMLTVADGSSVMVPVIRIKTLTIPTDGEPLVVNNVDVVVIADPNASILLGQNVMKELPKYEVNDIDQNLEFEDK